MKITKIVSTLQSNEVPPKALFAETVFQQCFAAKSTETVLIVADEAKKKEALQLLFDAQSLSLDAKVLFFDGMTGNAQEPPAAITKAMAAADIVLLMTTYSLSHTQARKQANQQGARIASLPGATFAMLERALTVDGQALATLSEQLASALTAASTITITTPAGTNLTASLQGRAAVADTGQLQQPGAFGNLPAGEAFIAPLEDSVSGTLVIDASLADVELDSPVTVVLEQSKVTSITGGSAAKELLQQIAAAGNGANIVGEIGLGTNPKADPAGDILESEKALGTAHVALGNNVGFGGTNQAEFHSDGVMYQPTVTVDDRAIIENGVVCL